jgi:hypothetical protein
MASISKDSSTASLGFATMITPLNLLFENYMGWQAVEIWSLRQRSP